MCVCYIATFTNKALVTKPWWCNIRRIMADGHFVVPDDVRSISDAEETPL